MCPILIVYNNNDNNNNNNNNIYLIDPKGPLYSLDHFYSTLKDKKNNKLIIILYDRVQKMAYVFQAV